MAELASMMNIGREMAKKLDSVGIGSAEELIRSGAEQAFLKLRKGIRMSVWCICMLWKERSAMWSSTAFLRAEKRN